MAYTTIDDSGLFFNTKLYTGTGSSLANTGVGFQPDFTWIKSRSAATDHALYDSVRGTTKDITSNTDGLETTQSTGLTTFGSDGFTVGALAKLNTSSATYAAWNWKAGTTGSGTTTGLGTGKAYSYSVNTTSGFSITKYLGNSTTGHTIPHTLGVVPKMLFVKKLTSAYAADWRYGSGMIGWDKVMFLNTTAAATAYTSGEGWNGTAPTSSVFTLGNDSTMNATDVSYIAYVFADKQGYSKFGSYVGNANNDGPFIYTGFKPAFVMIKITTAVNDWNVWDNKRDPINTSGGAHIRFRINTNEAENPNSDGFDILSNGFKIRNTYSEWNASGTLIYAAFAESPLVNSKGVPNNAR